MPGYGTEYSIGRPTGVCAATGRPLAPGEPCVAALCELPDREGLERLDFSAEAWDAGRRPDGLLGFWRTTVPQPHARRRALVDDGTLLDLFESLAGDELRSRLSFRFILALILMRKRQLKFVGRRGRGESERWLMLPRGAEPGSEIEVVNPRLTDDDVRELSDQLAEVLQGEL